MKSRRKILKIALALFGALVLAGLSAWLFPQQILTVDSGPVTADVMVVLGGGGGERPGRAAELFRAGEAPRLICSGLGDCTSNKKLVEKGGVPAAVIQTECESRNTSENARFTIKLLRQQGAKRVIIVTSWYHSRRALNCFEHYAPDLTFYSRPSYFATARADWKPKGVEGYIRLEYLKNLGYWVRYGVCPF
jgi:uncharacterized SAM-binding protein YcdF (DUF218 family)